MLYNNNQDHPSHQSLSYEQVDLINNSRILMSRMAYLTRFYIVESITGVGNPEVTFNQILELPIEENQLIETVPGFTGGPTAVTLNYLVDLKNIIDAMIAKDQAKADESIRKLYETSDQQASQLAGLSPYWDESTWRNLFYTYNKDLVAEVLAILTGDYNQALNIFEGLMQTALKMGDYYAEWLIHLLPEGQDLIPVAYFNMIRDFRQIGTEWAYLTRFYIVTKIVGLGNEKDVTEKFYTLILRIKEKVELVLGTETANMLSNSLLIYMIKLSEVVDAILAGDQADIDAKIDAVNQFNNQLSTYLGSVNPFWDEANWNELFASFSQQIVVQSFNLQRKESIAAIQNFEKLLYAALAISDYFAFGLYEYTQI